MANQVHTVNLLRKSFFPHGLTERMIRCVFRFASIAGILLAANTAEMAGNVIGFLVAWTGLLSLETSHSRALSTGALSSFWPGNRTLRILAGLTTVEIPALLLLVVLSFFARPGPIPVIVATALLLVQNVILLSIEARKTDGKNSLEQFVRDGGLAFITPIVLAAIALPMRDVAPMDTIVPSAAMVSVIGSEVSFTRRISSFTPGLFVPDYLRTEVVRFGRRQAAFVFAGTLLAGLLGGVDPLIAGGIALSLCVGSYLLHNLLFLIRSTFSRALMLGLFIITTSVLNGTASVIDEHQVFTVPIFLGITGATTLGAIAARYSLNDERIARNT